MKRTVLLIVMLSGLGAEAMAARVPSAWQPPSDSLLSPAPIETDLGITAPSLQPNFWDEDLLADAEPDDSSADSILPVNARPSGSPRVPEPPPATMLLLGLAILAIVMQLRRRKTIHYRRGRRLTVLR